MRRLSVSDKKRVNVVELPWSQITCTCAIIPFTIQINFLNFKLQPIVRCRMLVRPQIPLCTSVHKYIFAVSQFTIQEMTHFFLSFKLSH